MKAGDPGCERARILLVDDDPDLGLFLSSVLRSRGGFEVVHDLDPAAALRRAQTEPWDLVITDIQMPGMTGLELLGRVNGLRPGVPVVVLTAHASVEHAVGALRNAAADFLEKPITAEVLIAKATALIQAGRKARAENRATVLAIGAHPDDVEIGAGGTLLAHTGAGDSVAILTLSRGARGGDQAVRTRESEAAANVIGARLFLDDLEDTNIREGNPTIDAIDAVVAEVQPTVVYTHSAHDVHQDHRNVHRAVMVACRRVGRVYCFQSPSATVEFRPNYFVAINEYVGRKLEAIEAFGSQFTVRDYLEPDLIRATARYWSRYCAGDHAEPFETIRERAKAPSGPARRVASVAGATVQPS